ncbi:hypothetical protein BC830DRAFT_1229958 [Chytriomyces sp. MP71]|nr:hypothetical protein BC830DRAFT_1229958 [Chytriomyces sp. MP71]
MQQRFGRVAAAAWPRRALRLLAPAPLSACTASTHVERGVAVTVWAVRFTATTSSNRDRLAPDPSESIARPHLDYEYAKENASSTHYGASPETEEVIPNPAARTLAFTLALAVANGNSRVAQRAFLQLESVVADPANGLIDALRLLVEVDTIVGLMRLLASNSLEMSGTLTADKVESILDTCLLLLENAGASVPADVSHLLLERASHQSFDILKSLWSNIVAGAAKLNHPEGNTKCQAPLLPLETYNLVLQVCAQNGASSLADSVFGLLKEAAFVSAEANADGEFGSAGIATLQPNEISYLSVIKAHLNSDSKSRIKKALSIFQQMTIQASPSPTLPIFNVLIHASAKQGDFETAYVLLDSLMPAAGLMPDKYTYNSLLDAHAKYSDAVGAQKILETWRKAVFDRASDSAATQLEPPMVVTYNTLMNMIAKGDSDTAFDDAQALLETMTQGGIGVNTITVTAYMDVFKRRGDYRSCAEAFELFESRFGIRKFTAGYNVLLSCAGWVKDTAQMRAVYDEMLANGCRPSIVTFKILVSAHAACMDIQGMQFWIHEISRRGFSLELGMVESLAHTALSKGKLEKGTLVYPLVQQELRIAQGTQRPFRSSKLSNSILEAALHDAFVVGRDEAGSVGRTKAVSNIVEVLDVVQFQQLFTGAEQRPNAYTLKLLLNALDFVHDYESCDSEESRKVAGIIYRVLESCVKKSQGLSEELKMRALTSLQMMK